MPPPHLSRLLVTCEFFCLFAPSCGGDGSQGTFQIQERGKKTESVHLHLLLNARPRVVKLILNSQDVDHLRRILIREGKAAQLKVNEDLNLHAKSTKEAGQGNVTGNGPNNNETAAPHTGSKGGKPSNKAKGQIPSEVLGPQSSAKASQAQRGTAEAEAPVQELTLLAADWN
eukprot:3387468-Amphidinium_carterae.1